MNGSSRPAIFLGALLALCAAVPASGHPPTVSVHGISLPSAGPRTITSSPAPCSDSKYNLIGPKWTKTVRWSYKSSTTPSYLTTASVVAVLKKAFNNITTERNDCGRSDHVSATSNYLGTTSHAIGVTKSGTCGSSDGANTIGFGALPAGYLALTCVRSISGSIVETDMRISSGADWALVLAGCLDAFMLEAVTTHEVGHMYGLDHVGETNHGRLTMSTYIDGTCENQESTLGFGDDRALEVLY